MRAVAIKKGQSREKGAGFQEMGTLRCEGCGEEFVIGHQPAFVDKKIAEKTSSVAREGACGRTRARQETPRPNRTAGLICASQAPRACNKTFSPQRWLIDGRLGDSDHEIGTGCSAYLLCWRCPRRARFNVRLSITANPISSASPSTVPSASFEQLQFSCALRRTSRAVVWQKRRGLCPTRCGYLAPAVH
jgi:hypothetical protein